MPTGEERRGAVCGKIACTVRCRRREETRPVGKAVRPRRLPPTLPPPSPEQMLADERKQGPRDAPESGQEEKSAAPDSQQPRVLRVRESRSVDDAVEVAEPVLRLANLGSLACAAYAPCLRVRAGMGSRGASWLRLSGRDSALVGSLAAALLAEQNTTQPDDELLQFVRRGRRLLEIELAPAPPSAGAQGADRVAQDVGVAGDLARCATGE
jgi:hypothetical protein